MTSSQHHPSVFIKTLGCKVNLYDSQALAEEFQVLGYPITQDYHQARVMVLNTCSVTAQAEKDARYLLRRYTRDNPHALKVVTGCYAQIDSATLLTMPEVDYVIPNEAKHQLSRTIHGILQSLASPSSSSSLSVSPSSSPSAITTEKFLPGLQPVKNNRGPHFKSSLAYFGPQKSEKTRVFLKIQDGCNDFCTYCQIPYARGTSRSVASAHILEQITALMQHQTYEIVLTGIHLGEWGRDFSRQESFISLLERILGITENRARIRLSSLEPSEFTDDLALFIQKHQRHFCAHFHLPMQSGSSKILKLMRRRYCPQTYSDAIQKAQSCFSDHPPHLSADVMVGFPGEDEQDFHDSIALIEACGLHSLHVFPYSKRPNTAALKLPAHLPATTIRQRSQTLRHISSQRLHRYTKGFIDKQVCVIFENSRDDKGRIMGRTSHYLKVYTPRDCYPSEKGMIPMQAKGLLSPHSLLVMPISPSSAEAPLSGPKHTAKSSSLRRKHFTNPPPSLHALSAQSSV